MSGRIRFSQEEINQSIQKLYRIAEVLDECGMSWDAVCHDCLDDLPEKERDKIRIMGRDFNRLHKEILAHARKLSRISAVYEKVERQNKLVFSDLGIGLKEERTDRDAGSDRGRGKAALLQWNGRVRRKISLTRKIVTEDWLTAYLIQGGIQ